MATSAAVHDVKLEATREVNALRSAMDAELASARAAASERIASERAATDARRQAELKEAAQRRTEQINELQAVHSAALNEVRSFYEGVSSDQEATIARLKDELSSSRSRESALETQVADLQARCASLEESGAKSTQELKEARPLAAEALRNQASAASATTRAVRAEKMLQNLEYELEVKTQLATALATERDELLRALRDAAQGSSTRLLGSVASTPAASRPVSVASSALAMRG